ncbi:hypothetical protein GJ496_003330 [Pomphorhynchus laevis]|nr:hypothetical protein GJ496_003330 [Pomphorhynchus laevis]
MIISVVTLEGATFPINLSPSTTVTEFRQFCASRLKWPVNETVLVFEGKTIHIDDKLILSIIKDPDSIVLAQREYSSSNQSQHRRPQHQHFRSMPSSFTSKEESKDVQSRIAAEIRRRNIDQNMEMAFEHLPETFATVTMLYINCKVNGFQMKAFVDSGAQRTIMSKSCAEKCGLTHLLDSRFTGEAHGVGVQKIIGRVHLAQMEISGSFFATSFCVLEDQRIDILLGLDMLRRHQCIIDLEQNALLFKVNNGNHIRAPFLSDRDIPKLGLDILDSNSNNHNNISYAGQNMWHGFNDILRSLPRVWPRRRPDKRANAYNRMRT